MHMTIEFPTELADYEVERVLDDVHRVRTGARVVGYVLETGEIFVALRGSIFNTSIEVSQRHTLGDAVRDLASG